MKSFWQGLGTIGRFGLITCSLCVIVATGVAGYFLLRVDYQVLFADLSQQDAAAIGSELDRLKIPYMVSEQHSGGEVILVDKNDVYKTRIKLMGRDIPLHGAVGFELFNNNDFGMTEFAQKINYQRALQGELTRTILSLTEIRDARVMLALPEQGLFKQATSKAKASVTLTFKPGKSLGSDQVVGIQRLVSSSVPGIASQDVTIVDQNGIALTRVAGDDDAGVDQSTASLDIKKDTENYLSRKASDVLEHALGTGQALASVDVSLNMDHVQTTVEDVIPVPGKRDAVQKGVVVHERETVHDVSAPLSSRMRAGEGGEPLGGGSQREVEYAVGRRVEKVISQPGSIRRIQVVAIVKKSLDAVQQEQIRKLVAASVGASPDRGDTVVVQSIASVNTLQRLPATVPGAEDARNSMLAEASENGELQTAKVAHGAVAQSIAADQRTMLLIGIGLGILVVMTGGLCRTFFIRKRNEERTEVPRALSAPQRQAALAQIEAWVRAGDFVKSAGEVR